MKDCKRCGYGRVIRFSRGKMCHACAWQPGDTIRAAREPQGTSWRSWKDSLQRYHEVNALLKAHERDRKAIRQDTNRFNAQLDNYRRGGVYDPAPAHQMGLNLR